MPEIKVKINQGSAEESNSTNEVPSNDLTSLLSALVKAKEETNASLTKIVENLRDTKTTRKSPKDGEEGEDSSTGDDDDNAKKKQKT
jgi:hypothetical protein